MHINALDPNPGRCLNHRTSPDGNTVRCLDYEGTDHVCSFPPFPIALSGSASMSYSITTPEPKPWVKP